VSRGSTLLIGAWIAAGFVAAAAAGGAADPVRFVDRVWKVVESPTVAKGQLYVFLSEGTLVVASPTGTPQIGRWSVEDGRLEMIEGGIARAVDVIVATESALRLRIGDPGDGVELRLELAVPPPPPPPPDDFGLVGTAWRLVAIGDSAALAGVPTSSSPATGSASGRSGRRRWPAPTASWCRKRAISRRSRTPSGSSAGATRSCSVTRAPPSRCACAPRRRSPEPQISPASQAAFSIRRAMRATRDR
jgi:hypothetical protein